MRLVKPVVAWLLILSWTIQPATALDYSLPEMGEASGAYLGARQEQRLGKAFMRAVRASADVVNDPLLTGYIQSLGDRLASHSSSGSGNFTFFIVDNNLINAFAGPGGYIGIHSGLILESQTESELAAVLAHEIAHVSQRHIARMVQEAELMALPSAGILLAAILLGAAGGGDAAVAAAIGGQAALMQSQINFTRANEREADNVGMQILSRSKYDPRAMASFFQRMGRANSTGAITVPEFLMTHPVTSDRIADALTRAEKYPYRHSSENVDYHFVRAALRQKQFGGSKSAIKHFKSTLRDGRYRLEAAERYGYALALIRGRKWSEAREQLNKIMSKYPGNALLAYASAKVHIGQGNRGSAVSAMQSALKRRPGNAAISLALADIMIQARQPKSAYKLLKKLIRSHPENPEARKLMSRAAAGSKKPAESHAAKAEYHYLIGEPDVAVQQLKIALRQDDVSFQTRSKLEARMREMKLENEAMKKKKLF